MKHFHICRLLVPLALLVVLGLLLDSVSAGMSPAQGADKSLDIERYSNEPLELIELKIGEQPIKDKIAIKFRRNDEGLDCVTFKAQGGWFNRVSARLRNVSGRNVVGVRVYLYLKLPESQYRVQLAPARDLSQEPLQPGGEIDLRVTDQMWNPIAALMQQRSLNPDLASVTLSIESAMLSESLQWYRGHTLRRDAVNPNSWKPI